MNYFEGTWLIGSIVGLAITLLYVIGSWKVYEKAGKPGWAAIIPIYNIIVYLEIVNKPIWWIILLIIPGVNIVVAVMLTHRLSLSFGKDVLFTIGIILLGFIFIPLLGFGEAKYSGPPA